MNRTHFLILLFVSVHLSITAECSKKTKNTIEREKSIYIGVIFPRVFDSILSIGPETPIQIRGFFYLNLAQYNAWVNYHPTAVDIFGRCPTRRPKSEHSVENKNVAVLYSIFRVYYGSPSSFGGPSGIPEYRKLFFERGLDPDDTRTTGGDAISVGNRAGLETLRLLLKDGWNAEGRETSSVKNYQLPFQDTTDYAPMNAPGVTPRYPLRWAPLLETDGKGAFKHQAHVVPQAGKAITFSISSSFVKNRRVKSPYRRRNARSTELLNVDRATLKKSAEHVLRVSRHLTERQRLLAELFDNKVIAFRNKRSPGVLSIAAAIRIAVLPPVLDWSLDEEITYGIAANILSYDATVLVWKEKLRHDAVRPTGDTMRFLFRNKRKTVWGGPGKKPKSIRAGAWQSYIRTMPHSEFPSASACLCSALAEQALIYTNGIDDIPYNVTVPKGTSAFYPGKVPSSDVTFTIRKLSDWGTLCGKSRLFAGVHFPAAIPAGQRLCKNIAKQTQEMMDQMIAGTYKPSWNGDRSSNFS